MGMKKLLNLLIVFTICLGAFVLCGTDAVRADSSGTFGTCGWTIDDNNVLRIYPSDGSSGTLDSVEYDYGSRGSWPWDSYRTSITKVIVEPGVKTNSNCRGMFYNFQQCTEIDLSGLDTSAATDMANMFRDCSNLREIKGISELNVSKAVSIEGAFNNCTSLTALDLSSWKTDSLKYVAFADLTTSGVTNVGERIGLFTGCSGLVSLNLSGWNTSNIVNMNNIFDGCSNLKSLDLSTWDVGCAKYMKYMFKGCSSLTSLDLSAWDVRRVESMEYMFQDCSSLTSLDISGFNTTPNENRSTYVHGEDWLKGCSKLQEVVLGTDFAFPIFYYNHSSSLPTPPSYQDGDEKYYTGNWVSADGYYGPYAPSQLNREYTSKMAGVWVWEEKPFCTVTFAASGASGSMQNEVLFSHEDYEIPDCQYVIFDHTFLYWDDGQGNHYTDKDVIPAGRYEAGSAVTLTAVFEKNSHSAALEDGAYTFSIKAGETATFDNIPAGTSYQVYELTEDGWALVQQSNTSGVIEPLQESSAAFWNKYQPGVVTAQFTGTKKLDGQPAAAGSWEFELIDENGQVIQKKAVQDGGFIQFDPIEYTKDDLGVHTYTIREIRTDDDIIDYDTHEEVVTVNIIENGQTKYSHTDNISDEGVKESDYESNAYYTDVITIPGAKKLHVNVTYTNPRGSFYIWKGAYEAVHERAYDGDFNPATAFKQYSFVSGKDQEYMYDEFDVQGDSLTVLYSSYAYLPGYGYFPNGPYSDMVNFGYYMTISPELIAEVTYDEDGIAFSNKTRPGTLKISKNADGITDANADDTFTFEIELHNENGLPFTDELYWYVEGGAATPTEVPDNDKG